MLHTTIKPKSDLFAFQHYNLTTTHENKKALSAQLRLRFSSKVLKLCAQGIKEKMKNDVEKRQYGLSRWVGRVLVNSELNS